jgi:hypothetical protein
MIEPRTEIEAAALVAAGMLPSPTNYFGSELFAVRISGVGCAYRAQHDEFVWRDREIWLNDTTLRRCLGIPVVVGHPPQGVLDGEELAKRIIGIIIFSFVRNDEAWGVMRCLNHEAAAIIADADSYDSSPAVVFSADSGNEKITLPDGSRLLVETSPAILDHLAICQRGVWSKPGDAPGVEVTTNQTKELENAG